MKRVGHSILPDITGCSEDADGALTCNEATATAVKTPFDPPVTFLGMLITLM